MKHVIIVTACALVSGCASRVHLRTHGRFDHHQRYYVRVPVRHDTDASGDPLVAMHQLLVATLRDHDVIIERDPSNPEAIELTTDISRARHCTKRSTGVRVAANTGVVFVNTLCVLSLPIALLALFSGSNAKVCGGFVSFLGKHKCYNGTEVLVSAKRHTYAQPTWQIRLFYRSARIFSDTWQKDVVARIANKIGESTVPRHK